MVYREQFVAVVKSNGRILREKNNNELFLPFGSEYSILLKNLNSQRASVNIHIDGTDILNGSSLILEPNTDFELEGFLEGSKVKNKFKFIQKTEEISEYRGDKIDDGLIRIEYAFEKKNPITITTTHIHHDYYHHTPWWLNSYTVHNDHTLYRSSVKNFSSNIGATSDFNATMTSSAENVSCNLNYVQENSKPLVDEGITVKGAETRQDFKTTYIGELEEANSIILKLIGFKDNIKVSQPLTVKSKVKCETCGRKSKSSSKFCNNCGTAL